MCQIENGVNNEVKPAKRLDQEAKYSQILDFSFVKMLNKT